MTNSLISLQLGDVHPNRFRRIGEYILDPEKISALRNSITSSDFWVGLTVRKTDLGYELLYGHHRLAAAIEELGADHVHQFILRANVPDYMAIRMMASENSDAWAASIPHVTLSVSEARDYLDRMLDRYPTWDEATRAGEFTSPSNLEEWFGNGASPLSGANTGAANYTQCVRDGVGREVIHAFLGGAFTIGMVRTGLSMAGPSAKQKTAAVRKQAEAEAEAERLVEAAATGEAKAEEVEQAAEVAVAAKKKATELEEEARYFDASILPVAWNAAQCSAFRKRMLSPVVRSLGGLARAVQQRLVSFIEANYAMTSNGVDPRRKRSEKDKLPLTAKAIDTVIADYLDNLTRPEPEPDTATAARQRLQAKLEAVAKAMNKATASMAAATSEIEKQGVVTSGWPVALTIALNAKSLHSETQKLVEAMKGSPTGKAATRTRKSTPKRIAAQ